MNMTTVHVCCCLCTRQETVQVALPDGWRVDDIYEEDDALCPDHQAVEGFIASQCPGCVGGWGDCNLWRDFAFSRRGQTGLTENDLTSIRAGICPRRTNGTLVFSRETGVQSIDLSTAAPSEAGVALATAITEYIERYK